MKASLQDIRDRIPSILEGLENTLYAAAEEVRTLDTLNSDEYAEAILDQNGFGGDTAEIYLYEYAPDGSPSPSDRTEFQAMMHDFQRRRNYEITCYWGWKNEIEAVNGVVARRDGKVEVDGYALADYLREVRGSGQLPAYRVHVRISMPGQEKLRELRKIVRE